MMPKSESKAKWTLLEDRTLACAPVLEVIARDCVANDNGKHLTFYMMKSRDWCNIIPVTEDGKIVLVKQQRVGINMQTTEIPGGVTDALPGGGSEEPRVAALREMTEETGYEPLPGARCIDLGWSHSNPATFDNRTHGFIIGPVRRSKTQELDPGENIEVIEVPIGEIPRLIQERVISHSLMLNTFFFLLLQDSSVSGILTRSLEAFSKAPSSAPA